MVVFNCQRFYPYSNDIWQLKTSSFHNVAPCCFHAMKKIICKLDKLQEKREKSLIIENLFLLIISTPFCRFSYANRVLAIINYILLKGKSYFFLFDFAFRFFHCSRNLHLLETRKKLICLLTIS